PASPERPGSRDPDDLGRVADGRGRRKRVLGSALPTHFPSHFGRQQMRLWRGAILLAALVGSVGSGTAYGSWAGPGTGSGAVKADGPRPRAPRARRSRSSRPDSA